MAQRGTRATDDAMDVKDDAELTGLARQGEESAFDELYRRHAATAWHLAWATSADEAGARRATVEAFARAFTALRAGRAADVPFATLVRNQVCNVATDTAPGTDAAPGPVDGAGDPILDALRTLPITWRTACWLADGERIPVHGVAAALGLDATGTTSLLGRARAGWRERYLQHHFARSGNRNCSRAVGRMRALGEGPLTDADRVALDRHLRLCEPCAERMATAADLGSTLAASMPVVPVLLVDDVRAAWAAAVHTSARRTGLSPRTEKVLAGATAAVAALGLVGAAILGTGRSDAAATDATTRMAAPAAADRSTDLPLELSTVPELSAPGALPIAASAAVGGVDDGDGVQPLAGDGAVPLTPTGDDVDGNGGAGAPGTGGGPGDGSIPNEGPGDDDPVVPDDAVPTAAVAVTVADVPVAVSVGAAPGATVGPVSVGSAPEPAPANEPSVTVGGPLAPAQPAVDQVVGGL